MQKQKTIDLGKNQSTSTQYVGIFKDFQTLGEVVQLQQQVETQKFHQNIETPEKFSRYTEYQNFLYQRARFGLTMYTPEEVRVMHPQKRERIKKVQQRTQKELNTWKQNRLIALTNRIFSIFHNSNTASQIIESSNEEDPSFNCTISFKELGFTKEDIINVMIEKKLLPYNFRSIQ